MHASDGGDGGRDRGRRDINTYIAKPGTMADSIVSKGRGGGRGGPMQRGRGTEKEAVQDQWSLDLRYWSLGFKAFTLDLPHARHDFGIPNTTSVNGSTSTFLTSKIRPSWMSAPCAWKTEQCRLYHVCLPVEHPSQIPPRADRADVLDLLIKSPCDKHLDWGSTPPSGSAVEHTARITLPSLLQTDA